MKFDFLKLILTSCAVLFGTGAFSQNNVSEKTLTIFCSTAIKSTVLELLPSFEKDKGIKVDIVFNPTSDILTSLSKGNQADVVILTKESIDDLLSKSVLASPRVDFASTGIGVAMKKGLPQPDISTTEKFKNFLLQIPSLSYTSNGVSGVYTAKMIEKLGLTQALANKTKLVNGGFAAELIASGEVLYSIQNISELMPVPGIAIIGPLPNELQLTTTFSGAMTKSSLQNGAMTTYAEYFLKLLKSDAAKQVFTLKGMNPS